MSSAPSNSGGTVASCTRRQTRICARGDDGEEEKQPAQSSAHASPAMRIYRHALESIFAMLQLSDLSRALAVSRSWSAAVASMRPIGARISGEFDIRLPEKLFRLLPPIETLLSSPLLRHLGDIEIGKGTSLVVPSCESLALLAQHAPNLTSLCCELTFTEGAPLIFPAQLTSLKLALSDEPTAAELNDVLMTLSALPHLSRLQFTVIASAPEVDLRILAASSSLIDLTLVTGRHTLSTGEVERVRSAFGHLHRISVTRSTDTLERLLQPPVTVRWQDIGTIHADARTGDLLVRLPTLTTLDLFFRDDAPHADFLFKLPLLRSLTLWSSNEPAHYIPADATLGSLLACTGLTELSLDCGLNSAQFCSLLAKLTKLRQLKVHGVLESLQCFASGPIAESLEELELSMLQAVPLSDVSHLFALHRLRKLKLWRCFISRLDATTVDSLLPPSSLLPSLTDIDLCWLHPGWRWDVVKRSGPSFDWMRQRLAQ